MTTAIDLGREGTVVDAIKKLKTKIFGLPDFGPRYIPMRDANSKYETSYLNILNLTDIRACVRQVILTVGKPLHTASGPRQLVIALRDALFGLRNLYRLGYVHRDVSSGNTYITEPMQGFHILRDGGLGKETHASSGMAGDFDLCIGRDDKDRQIHSHRTGTLPFMAIDLLSSLQLPYHSPIHDMESVMWVLVWVVGHKNVDVAGDEPNPQDVKLCDDMSVANMTMDLVAHRKRSLLHILQRLTSRRSGNLEPFRNLLVEGFNLVDRYVTRSEDRTSEEQTFSDEEVEEAFTAYLDVFEKNIPVETDWSHVKGGP
ncbi:hypothetical protein BD410DRAFT_202879 [Rickenella mellea]|uniref:Protein kinase domain-containing protein n=1 Tax=Rickenella mellea TaxID=50990 RepID=A0A4Y7Q6C9_9AGAM|nr:hypothetical protein BD410DRAFT_202879 [Rickenella mellea]